METTSFYYFLEMLKTNSNSVLLESIKKAFSALYEIPHGETIDGRPIDFHVEDVIHHNNRADAISYIHGIITSLQKNHKIYIPYANSGEVTEIENPLEELSDEQLKNLIKILKYIEFNMQKNN